MEKAYITEKRMPVLCANCKTQMVGMNKYILLKDCKEVYIWYICPRRKESGEKGCGHKTSLKIKRSMISNEAELVFDHRLTGQVQWNDKLTMIIQDNLETFDTWLHRNREKFKDKRVEIILRVIEEKETV